jgi:hypothetical protein
MGNCDAQIERIVAKLEKAELRTGTTLEESEVGAFEAKWSVRLPEPYRQFLLRIGNGGVGPYDFFRFEQWSEQLSLLTDEIPPDYLSTPSILAQRMFEDFSARKSSIRVLTDANGVEYKRDYAECGLLAVCHCGCHFYITLVVSGPHAGRLLYFGGFPYFSEEPDFLSWYERWLDEGLAGYNLEYFGWGPAGDEPTVLKAAERLPKEVLLRSIMRFTRLSEEGMRLVCGSLTDNDALIRDLGLYALLRLNVRPPRKYIPTLRSIMQSDPDFTCRNFAKRILQANPPERLEHKVERFLMRLFR